MADDAGVAAIVLAAGGSTRFGKSKQLHRYAGAPLIRRAVDAVLATGIEDVVVVIGSDAGDVENALHGVPRARCILNADWSTGLASSIKVGLSEITPATDGVLIALSDQPLVDSSALSKLLMKFDKTHRIVASSYADTVGVPAVFGHEHFPELRALTGDRGAGRWIRARIADVTIVPLEAAAIDIDTPADAARLEEL